MATIRCLTNRLNSTDHVISTSDANGSDDSTLTKKGSVGQRESGSSSFLHEFFVSLKNDDATISLCKKAGSAVSDSPPLPYFQLQLISDFF